MRITARTVRPRYPKLVLSPEPIAFEQRARIVPTIELTMADCQLIESNPEARAAFGATLEQLVLADLHSLGLGVTGRQVAPPMDEIAEAQAKEAYAAWRSALPVEENASLERLDYEERLREGIQRELKKLESARDGH